MNPLSLRRTPKVICIAFACVMLPACAGLYPIATRDRGNRTASIQDALVCDNLVSVAAESLTVAPGRGHVDIKFPASHPVAVLRVPRAAVTEPTTFVLQIDNGATSRALVNITARRGTTNVTTFREPLLLKLFVRSGCKPSKPAKDSTFYIYTMRVNAAGNDTTLVEGHGNYIDPILFGHKRVEALLDHLSGYILAQGFR